MTHFIEVSPTDGKKNTRECKHCGCSFSVNTSDTHLQKHLARMHPKLGISLPPKDRKEQQTVPDDGQKRSTMTQAFFGQLLAGFVSDVTSIRVVIFDPAIKVGTRPDLKLTLRQTCQKIKWHIEQMMSGIKKFSITADAWQSAALNKEKETLLATVFFQRFSQPKQKVIFAT
jgi:hypothetical protein